MKLNIDYEMNEYWMWFYNIGVTRNSSEIEEMWMADFHEDFWWKDIIWKENLKSIKRDFLAF